MGEASFGSVLGVCQTRRYVCDVSLIWPFSRARLSRLRLGGLPSLAQLGVIGDMLRHDFDLRDFSNIDQSMVGGGLGAVDVQQSVLGKVKQLCPPKRSAEAQPRVNVNVMIVPVTSI